MTERALTKLETISIIVGIIVGIVGVIIGLNQLSLNRQIQSGEFVLKLSKRLDAIEFDKLRQVIFDNKSDFNLYKKFTEMQIDAYLSQLETIGNLYESGLISNPIAYDEFSYDFEKTYCNQSIKKYILDLREKDGNKVFKKFYVGFENMSKIFLQLDKKTCTDVDKGP